MPDKALAILLPVLGKAREQAHRVVCLANLRSLGQIMFEYANSNRGRLPNGNIPGDADPTNGDQVLVRLAVDFGCVAKVFHCPSDQDPPPASILNNYISSPNSARVSYDFYSIYWVPEKGPILCRLRGQAPLAWDLDVGSPPSPLQNHGTQGGNVLYADDHVDWQRVKEWDKINWPHPANEFYSY